MANDSNSSVQFGRYADDGGDKKVWFFVIPAILALIALAGVGIYGISQSSSVKDEIAKARAQVSELQKSVDERDKLLVTARGDERLLKSAGQATALFYGSHPDAVESGLIVAQPGDRAAKVLLYGLQPPADGQVYTVAARGGDGALHAIRDVPVGPDGSAFVLAKDLPEGTTAIELVLRPGSAEASGVGSTGGGDGEKPEGGEAAAQGTGAQPAEGGDGARAADGGEAQAGEGGEAQAGEGDDANEQPRISLEGATPRVAARFPQEGERGVLTQAPAAQARAR